jgi:sugar phosphate isomerase/epimerase
VTLGRNDMILPHWAMVDFDQQGEITSRSFADRCEAAAAGSFAAIGIHLSLYRAERAAGRTDAELRALLDDHGIVLAELEGISLLGHEADDAVRAEVDALLDVVEALGGERCFAVARDGIDAAEYPDQFGWVCDRCADADVAVGIEFINLPGVSGLRTLRSVLDVADEAGRPNGGVMLDTYHFFNGPNGWDELERCPNERVIGIQFADGGIPPEVADYRVDTMSHRAPPGEGDFDLVGFVQTMDAIGVDCAYSVEVLDADLRGLSNVEVGTRLGDATRAVFAAARGQS